MAKYLLGIISFFITTILLSCNTTSTWEEKYIRAQKKADDRKAYFFSTDSFTLKGASAPYYTYDVKSHKGRNYFIGYNASQVSFDLFDLYNGDRIQHVSMEKDSIFSNVDRKDQDKGKSVADILFINFDSILVNYGNSMLLLVDSAFRVKKTIDLKKVAALNGYRYGTPISYSHTFKMRYLPETKELLLESVYNTKDFRTRKDVFLLLHLETLRIRSLPIQYTDFFHDTNGSVGMVGQINTAIGGSKEDKILYNYQYESNIYEYSIKDRTITAYGASSELSKNIVDPLIVENIKDEKEWRIHSIENTSFFPVIYDEFRNLYYRFHFGDMPYKNGKYFNSYSEKPLVLMVFNAAFEVIDEIRLPDKKYLPGTGFVAPAGLLLGLSGSDAVLKNGGITYEVFDFKKKH